MMNSANDLNGTPWNGEHSGGSWAGWQMARKKGEVLGHNLL